MPPRIENPLSIAATAVAVIAVWWLAVRGGLLGAGPVSIAIQVLGLTIMIWARLTFGMRSFHLAANPTSGGLVTSGPYHYVRNPIYLGALLVIFGGAAAHLSPANFALALVAGVALVTRILCEEPLLRRGYPEYAIYAAKTPRLLPFLI